MVQDTLRDDEKTRNSAGIVSVNERGGSGDGLAGKIIFCTLCAAVIVIGGLVGFNQWRASHKSADAAAAEQSKIENKPAQVGTRRFFSTDPPASAGAVTPSTGETCDDGMPGTVLMTPDGHPMSGQDGAPLRVCKNGRVLVPALLAGGAPPPIGLKESQQSATGTPPSSRYGGDVIVPAPSNSSAPPQQTTQGNTPNGNVAAQLASLQQAITGGRSPVSGSGTFGGGSSSVSSDRTAGGGPSGGTATQQSAIGSLLEPSATPMVTAAKIDDLNMLLPKGRTIDCGLSIRLINEVSGMATCVLTANVYSDNGKVVLLEKGSEAVGEYVATMAQGQRRIFVLWNRVKTPNGVVINLNSPAADELGTMGMPGYVDNRWWERIGAAFLLSLVQDAVAIETASKQGGSDGVVFQNSTRTTDTMAQRVLESTINIKPTLYKNQGDRGTIFVARDLDFASVYALRAR